MKERAFKFTLKDVIVLALLLAIVYIVSQKIILREQLKMPTQEMEVRIVAEGISEELAKAIIVGDSIYQKGAMFPFGKIVAKEEHPAKRVIADQMGQHQIVHVDDLRDVTLDISAPGFVSLAGSPIIDNTFFYSNQYLPVFTDHAVFTSRVIRIGKD